MPESYSVRFVSDRTEKKDDDFLVHYGIKGQRWGFRRFQNEDGSYTQEGLARRLQDGYGRARAPVRNIPHKLAGSASNSFNEGFARSVVNRFEGRKPSSGSRSSSINLQSFANNPKQAVKNMLGIKSRKKGSKAQQKARKERAKKIMIAAGAVTLAAAAAYGIHRYGKTSENLSQLAKNKIHEEYEKKSKGLTGEALRNVQLERQKAMFKADYRSNAKKVLGLHGHKQTKDFIKQNKVYKMKLEDLVEKRHGPLVEGVHVSKFTHKLNPLKKRKINKMRRLVAESMKMT